MVLFPVFSNLWLIVLLIFQHYRWYHLKISFNCLPWNSVGFCVVCVCVLPFTLENFKHIPKQNNIINSYLPITQLQLFPNFLSFSFTSFSLFLLLLLLLFPSSSSFFCLCYFLSWVILKFRLCINLPLNTSLYILNRKGLFKKYNHIIITSLTTVVLINFQN